MGCTTSKLEMESQAKLTPGLRSIRRKIEEVKKCRHRKRSRRYSIVSTTKLLEPGESDPTGDTGSSSGKVKASAVAPEPIKEEEQEEVETEDIKKREVPKDQKKKETKEKIEQPKGRNEEPKSNSEDSKVRNQKSEAGKEKSEELREQMSEKPKEKSDEPKEKSEESKEKSEEPKVRNQKSEEPKEKSGEELKEKEEEKDGAKLIVKTRNMGTDHEEYVAGSPSFRFYCIDQAASRNNQSFDSEDSVKLSNFTRSAVDQKHDGIKVRKTSEPIEEVAESQSSSESSACSSVAKREKGRKLFRNLTKAPSAVKGLFTCYSTNSKNSPFTCYSANNKNSPSPAATNHQAEPCLLSEKTH